MFDLDKSNIFSYSFSRTEHAFVSHLPIALDESARRMIRKIQIGFGLMLLPLLVWLLLVAMNVQLPLSFLNVPLSRAFSSMAGRHVSFKGDITLAPALIPTLEITGISVSNPDNREGHLMQLGRVYLRMDLWSLLFGDVVIESLEAQGVVVDLNVYEDGSNNWQLGLSPLTAADEPANATVDAGELVEV